MRKEIRREPAEPGRGVGRNGGPSSIRGPEGKYGTRRESEWNCAGAAADEVARALARLVFRVGPASPFIGRARVSAVTGRGWNRGVARRVMVRVVPRVGVDPENFPRRAERKENREEDREGSSRSAPTHRVLWGT